MDLQAKIREYVNVLKMARKPDREEFIETAKISIAVMFVVGFIGFVVYVLMEIVPQMVR